MSILLAVTDSLDVEFVKFLLYGLSAGIVAIAGAFLWLVKRYVDDVARVSDVARQSADALEESTEALKEAARAVDRCKGVVP